MDLLIVIAAILLILVAVGVACVCCYRVGYRVGKAQSDAQHAWEMRILREKAMSAMGWMA